MKKIQKFVAVIVFLLGSVAVANAFYPGIDEKLADLVVGTFFKEKKEESGTAEEKTLQEVLGETTKDEIKNFQEQAIEQLKEVPDKVITEERITEVKEVVNQVVVEKVVETVEENKDIPQQGVEQAKEEVRKKVYQEICGEWLQVEKTE